jgi:xylan 1,4-beta-xylosidase
MMTCKLAARGILAGAVLCAVGVAQAQTSSAPEKVVIRADAPGHDFPHFWEEMFGSGRAILTLRQSYRDDLKAVKAITDLKYVRFHAILHDEVGVYNEDEHGNPVYNFAYVDQIYDGLLAEGVKPVVEISFMPKKLAFNPDALHPFWYKQNVSPPKSMELWDDLMKHFAQHLVDRYGIDEVSQWYFEVWNEPNIDFWNGIPRDQSYFELYAHTARALKSVNPKIRVGGPATSAAHWIPEFLDYATKNHVPVDFVSTHGYADDSPEDMLGTTENIPMDERVCRAVAKVHAEIQKSAMPNLPLFWTEWNVQGNHDSRDTPFVGPGVANTIRQCDGLVDMMSFWTFSDVFEEGGPIPTPFEGHFGLRAEYGINKPSFYDFALLHQLGSERLANDSQNVIVTRDKNGALIVAVWNIVDPGTQGAVKNVTLEFQGVKPDARVSVQRVDADHGNPMKAYIAMGKPQYPTPKQVAELNAASALGQPEVKQLQHGELELDLGVNALVLIKVEK